MKHPSVQLPDCGMFIGSPIYLFRGDYIFQTSGKFYTSWVSEDHDAAWYLDRVVKDNQGNLVALWDGRATAQSLQAMADYMALDELGLEIPKPDWERKRYLRPEDWDEIAKHPERLGAGLVRLTRLAAENDLYVMGFYTDADPRQLKRLEPWRDRFLGCNVGEVFTFRLNDEDNPIPDTTGIPDLELIARTFTRSVRNCVEQYQRQGWGPLMVTGGIATLDYEIIGGISMPLVEDFAVPHLNVASAMARGLCKQFDLPLWGTDLAHEHYSWLPYASKYKFPMLNLAFNLKYMSGCKLVLLESGNWWQQSDHVEDTPMHQVPKLDLGSIRNTDPRQSAPYVAEARKHYPQLNYDSPVCRRYRKCLSDFYDFVKRNGTPEGQPEVRLAAIKGRFDLATPAFNPNAVIAGQYDVAEQDPRWFYAAPERGWEIFTKVFYPRPRVLGEYSNPFFSGTPYGMTDIVSFAVDPAADHLSRNYAALLFAGWNTCTPAQYAALISYVSGGGTLFVSIPHLSTNKSRNFLNYNLSELINDGDFSDLCGVKIKGRGKQFYWAVTPEKNGPLGVSPYRKFGPYMVRRGELEICGDTEVIAVEDENFQPVLLRHRLGQGIVYFLNTWDYPGALDIDEGPGSRLGSTGLIGALFSHIASQVRGRVWISDDGQVAGPECNTVCYSYFPQDGSLFLQNIDFDQPHAVFLHGLENVLRVDLAPGEFRMIKA